MLGVVFHLEGAPILGLSDRAPDRIGKSVGVEDDPRVGVPRCPADRLDEAPLVSEETLLVRVQNPDEPHLRDVEPLPEEVDPHQDVELSEA